MIEDLVARLRSLDIEPSHIVESVAREAAARITELEAENERLKVAADMERGATTYIVHAHGEQQEELWVACRQINLLERNLEQSIARSMADTSERAAMVAAHRAREGRLKDAEKVAAQSVGKLKTLGYRLDAVRQELTARAEKVEAERDALAAVVEIVAQSAGQTITDDLTAMALRALGRGR